MSNVHTVVLTVMLVSLVLALYAAISKLLVVMYVVLVLFVTFGCPWWFISMQKYKKYMILLTVVKYGGRGMRLDQRSN